MDSVSSLEIDGGVPEVLKILHHPSTIIASNIVAMIIFSPSSTNDKIGTVVLH